MKFLQVQAKAVVLFLLKIKINQKVIKSLEFILSEPIR
jgi:hypothetical protein